MAAVEATAPPLERPQEDPKLVSMEDDDPKAALKKALLQDGENEDQILFSCNICYEVSLFLGNLLYFASMKVAITTGKCSR